MQISNRWGSRVIMPLALLALIAALPVCTLAEAVETVAPVSFADVRVDGGLWAKRLQLSRTVTIPECFKHCEESGRIDNFAVAAGLKEGEFQGAHYNDSDVYKVVQGAVYCLAVHPDPKLQRYVDDVIAKIAAAQQPDGYLDTYFMGDRKAKRFQNISPGPRHELYCMGHLIEASVAHYELTGKRTLLDVAIRLADHIGSVFGPGKRDAVPHHQELESALIKLYRVTHQPRHLQLAKFFVDRRGHFENRPSVTFYGQDHLPVRQQTEIVGHAVRGMYHCVNIASLYAETGDAELLATARRLWESATQRKLYVTGAVGSVGRGESFGNDYQLPNGTAYAETCAGIGLVYFAHQMWQITPDAQYIDVLERALYNEVLGGVAITGDAFFYNNKLLSTGEGWGSLRQRWFRCACCPSNVCRFMPAVPGYLYGHRGDDLYLNTFMPSTATVKMDGRSVTLAQQTDYPWDGKIKITVTPAQPAEFTIHVRIPGWARNRPSPGDLYRYADETLDPPVRLQVNGEPVAMELQRGYAAITRQWTAGDVIQLDLPMPVRRVLAHEKVVNNHQRVALQRGPIVYCAEWPDNEGRVLDIVLDDDVALKAERREDLLHGVTVLTGTLKSGKKFTAIPFYARANRDRGEMNVWIARTQAAAQRISTGPIPHDWESWGSLGASHVYPPSRLSALEDDTPPQSSGDLSEPYFTWQYHVGGNEWVRKTFAEPTTVSSVEVYWLDQGEEGPCRMPESWRVLYRDDNKWKLVENTGPYGLDADQFNRVAFQPITTTVLRMEATLEDGFSGGVLRWRVK
ncbi:MAG: glycoside hydrolase family 127 protein [Planctomycetes bacterium]|nr:glycoside hydrolase family 127 protein [Planctomycetota bacterium]